MNSAPSDYKSSGDYWKNESLPYIEENRHKPKIVKPKNPSQLEYEENIRQPAGRTFLPADFVENQLTEILPGCCWVLPNVLTPSECKDWIGRGKAAGLELPSEAAGTIRTNSRTQYYHDKSMSTQIESRLPFDLIGQIERSAPGTAFRGVHDNWKIARYNQGGAFPAHYDQDSYQTLPPNEDGVKERETTSHTVLLYLADDFEGGATRFFPVGNFKNPSEAVDVRLPQGAMLVFRQYGLLHGGMEITRGIKMIAQSGILRSQPAGLIKPAVFKWGPGLNPY